MDWPEGEGLSVENGGNEGFGVVGLSGVYRHFSVNYCLHHQFCKCSTLLTNAVGSH